jgi:hypothetical protein
MSMYTQLLTAALGQHPPAEADTEAEQRALDEVLHSRAELEKGVPPGTDGDTVPRLLALQVAYDVALIALAWAVDIDTGPHRFDLPELERARLEQALGELGFALEATNDVQRANGRT